MPIPELVRGVFAFLLGLTLALGVGRCAQAATTILPPGATCFSQATGPLSSGSIFMLVPNTTTPKNTWKDSGQAALNSNPIQLDANGCAIIFGTGSYRQQVYTGPVVAGLPTGTLLYDVVTTDTSAPTSVFWAGTSGGTPNAITVTDAGFANTDGAVINFLALNTNTGATTLNVSGGGAIAIKNPSTSGPVAVTSGCIVANNPISVVYSATQNAFLLLTACSAAVGSAAAVPIPGGYLTLSSDTNNPILSADSIGATTVFYTTYSSNQIPIWNGTTYVIFTFSQLQLVLGASANLSNTIYDVCVFSNSGSPTLVTGPAWSNSAAGTGARGTGAGSTQISRVSGLWVNTVQISGNNGASTFTIPANQCTYVGSLLIDQAAGQVSNYLSYGQNRKWGVWNAYNRQPIILAGGDPTASWNYATANWRFSDGTSGNGVTALTGLAEERENCQFNNTTTSSFNNASSDVNNAVGVNWTTGNPTGTWGQFQLGDTTGTFTLTGKGNMVAQNAASPTLGINTFNALEITNSNGSTTFLGTPNHMLLQCNYRG